MHTEDINTHTHRETQAVRIKTIYYFYFDENNINKKKL